MDAQIYPGKGLSLSQLVFALNEELRRTVCSPSFAFDNVSRLEEDVSTALANIREWRNSFTSTAFRWMSFPLSPPTSNPRRTVSAPVMYAVIGGEIYVKNLLERARGPPLDIITDSNAPLSTITLLSLHTRQIRSLDFAYNHWTDVRQFSEINSGPLPLLRTLEIGIVGEFRRAHQPDPVPSSLSLLSNAVNLEQFVLRSERSPFLNHFVFPNLATFELWTMPAEEGFQASELVNFLEASPMLRTVDMRIIGDVLLEDVAQRRVVVLPGVQTFSLAVSDRAPGYELAAHISCPSASHTSLTYEKHTQVITADQDIFMFPTAAPRNAIVRQYTRNPVEAVALEIKPSQNFIACTLTFRAPDMTAIRLDLEVSGNIDEDEGNGFQMSLEDMTLEVFSRASRTVRDHPLLPDIKRLHIECGVLISEPFQLRVMADEFERLFRSVGPLDELTLCGFNLRSCVTPFLPLPESKVVEQSIVFSPIKELTISHPMMMRYEEECMDAVVELAKSQHALGSTL